MTKKEKIAASLIALTILMLIISNIITATINKPSTHIFRYEQWIQKIIKQ